MMTDKNPMLQPTQCQIRLKGHLGPRWEHRFDGFAIQHLPDGSTLLTGEVADQAALFGILCQVINIGIPLLEVHCRDKANEQSR